MVLKFFGNIGLEASMFCQVNQYGAEGSNFVRQNRLGKVGLPIMFQIHAQILLKRGFFFLRQVLQAQRDQFLGLVRSGGNGFEMPANPVNRFPADQ